MNYLQTDHQEDHLCLDAFTPAERQAIIEHKYFMGIDLGFDPGIVTAIESWLDNHAAQWRADRMQYDCQCRVREIQRHRSEMVEHIGHDVAIEQAARDWISNCAESWREKHQL